MTRTSNPRGISRIARMDPPLALYLLFTVSWFLHLGSRIPLLGMIRFDLILVFVLGAAAVQRKSVLGGRLEDSDRYLRILIVYALATLPFVEWPGSVVHTGLPNFVKGIVFFYFTIAFVQTEADLRKLVFVFVACQVIRILEPLYLHVTEGYWGAVAYMSGGTETLQRLSGAPSDVVNPNGLAFIICTALPFIYFLAGRRPALRVALAVVAAASLYALYLTGSRSGMLGLAVVFAGILLKAKPSHRVLLIVGAAATLAVAFPRFSPELKDRYLSTFGLGERNVATAEGRREGVEQSFALTLRRPFFGHGLGTSREANVNFNRVDQPAHNLYAEVAIELGFVGLVLWLLFMKSIVTGLVRSAPVLRRRIRGAFVQRLLAAMQVWLAMNLVFSFASYGLSSYEWYLMGGITVVLRRLAKQQSRVGMPGTIAMQPRLQP